MDRKYIDDNHVVARYLADQLPENEREAFESYLAANPEIVDELEATARFKVGLAALADAGTLDNSLRRRRATWIRPALAVAAGVALAVVAVSLWLNRSQIEEPLMAALASELRGQNGNALPTVATQPLIRTRASEQDAVIQLPGNESALELRVLPEEESTGGFAVELFAVSDDQRERRVAALRRVKVTHTGFVVLYLRSSTVRPGNYRLRVRAEDTTYTQDPSVFSLRFVRPPVNQ
jgi:hypothetical protein